jgi:hypothetical protein
MLKVFQQVNRSITSHANVSLSFHPSHNHDASNNKNSSILFLINHGHFFPSNGLTSFQSHFLSTFYFICMDLRLSERSPFDGSCCGGYTGGDDTKSCSSGSEPTPPPRYRVVMLGDSATGKTGTRKSELF